MESGFEPVTSSMPSVSPTAVFNSAEVKITFASGLKSLLAARML